MYNCVSHLAHNTAYIVTAVTPPLEPPILDFTSPGGLENEPITIYVSARPVRPNITINDVLGITLTGLPAMATLSKGSRMEDGTWKITEDEFGNLDLQLPTHFSGMLQLTAIAYFENHQNTTLRSRDLVLAIEPVPNAPRLMVQDACYSASAGDAINLVIESSLIDTSGSEELSLVLRRIPENIAVDEGSQNSRGEYVLTPADLPNIQLRVLDEFQPFTMEVIAYSTVATTMRQANTSKLVTITECEIEEGRQQNNVIITVSNLHVSAFTGLTETRLQCNHVMLTFMAMKIMKYMVYCELHSV